MSIEINILWKFPQSFAEKDAFDITEWYKRDLSIQTFFLFVLTKLHNSFTSPALITPYKPNDYLNVNNYFDKTNNFNIFSFEMWKFKFDIISYICSS